MNKEWVEKQWQEAELGDKRLNKRAVKIGLACLETRAYLTNLSIQKTIKLNAKNPFQ